MITYDIHTDTFDYISAHYKVKTLSQRQVDNMLEKLGDDIGSSTPNDSKTMEGLCDWVDEVDKEAGIQRKEDDYVPLTEDEYHALTTLIKPDEEEIPTEGKRSNILDIIQARRINPQSCLPTGYFGREKPEPVGCIFEAISKSNHPPYPILEEDPEE